MTLQHALIFANLVLTVWVVKVNLGEAFAGFKELRWTRLGVAIFAGIYSCSYLLLLSGAVERLVWSQVMVGVSLPVWFFVWGQPARRQRQLRQRTVNRGVSTLDAARAKRNAA